MSDLIIRSAHIRTMAHDADAHTRPTAAAVVDGRIAWLGTDEDAAAWTGPRTHVIDAQGATLTPGLIDSHMHPVGGIEMTQGADLGGLVTLAQVRSALAEHARTLEAGDWLRGWNLDYKAFEGGEIRGDLFEDAAQGRPLLLLLFDVHTSVANEAALEAAGVDGSETFDDASEIVVDEYGRPTGKLQEMPAFHRVLRGAPGLHPAEAAHEVQRILSEAAAAGVTGTTVLDGRDWTVDVIRAAEALPGGLPVRLDVAMWHEPGDGDDLVAHRVGMLGVGGDRWRVRMIKMFLDGVIDAGTAWLHQPDAQGDSTGPFWKSLDRFAEVCRSYHDAGFQLTTHSCGDAGVAHAARVYEGLSDFVAGPARIEHLETLTDDDVALLSRTGTVASMQPLHMQWREPGNVDSWGARLGDERASNSWRTRDILQAGGRLALGSDWPVASLDARLGMAWARLRREPGNPSAPVFESEQRLTGEEALLGYTRWAAEALGDGHRGVIRPGATADLTLWAEDPVTADADELTQISVLMTTIDGKIVHNDPLVKGAAR